MKDPRTILVTAGVVGIGVWRVYLILRGTRGQKYSRNRRLEDSPATPYPDPPSDSSGVCWRARGSAVYDQMVIPVSSRGSLTGVD